MFDEGPESSQGDQIRSIAVQGEEIAIRIFRLQARRGIGVFYLSFAIFIITSFIVEYITNSAIDMFIYWIPAGFLVWYVPRVAGFRGFGRFAQAISMIEGFPGKTRGSRILHTAGSLLFAFWPWIFFVVFLLYGYGLIAIFFPPVWFIQAVIKRYLQFRKGGKIVIDQRIEDWAVLIVLAVASILIIVPHVGLLGFLYVSPILIMAGGISLYRAPEEVIHGW